MSEFVPVRQIQDTELRAHIVLFCPPFVSPSLPYTDTLGRAARVVGEQNIQTETFLREGKIPVVTPNGATFAAICYRNKWTV